jgi:glycine cleavage system regulatory protein
VGEAGRRGGDQAESPRLIIRRKLVYASRMKTQLVVTVIGPDRPGLVRAISQEVAAAGGDWLESRMTTLAGRFAGVVQVAVPGERAPALIGQLRALESHGLKLVVETGSGEPIRAGGHLIRLELVGQDHPGIVRDVSRLLAERRISVEALDTETVSGPFSGEMLFKARARLRVPADVNTDDLRAALEALANELMVDATLDERPAPDA